MPNIIAILFGLIFIIGIPLLLRSITKATAFVIFKSYFDGVCNKDYLKLLHPDMIERMEGVFEQQHPFKISDKRFKKLLAKWLLKQNPCKPNLDLDSAINYLKGKTCYENFYNMRLLWLPTINCRCATTLKSEEISNE